jgi:hypothetical protein
MNSVCNYHNQEVNGEFSTLKKSIDKQKKAALKKRIAKQPHATGIEYLLGAFKEMYEPHLEEIINLLAEKGYAIDASSGFGGKNSEYQVMIGDFTTDFMTRNKLEKIGVKFREYNGSKSLVFYPEKATLDDIKEKWMKIVNVLPDKGTLTALSSSYDAVSFRRKYIPENHTLRKQQLFDKLKFSIQKKTNSDAKKRIDKNPHPNKMESVLGFFVEGIEPQVRQAIVTLFKKGYSTDASGFADNSYEQMIEGDFQLEEKTRKSLKDIGVQVETNPSGYTRIQFTPAEPSITKIKNKWNEIIALIPRKNQAASISMTRKAREFRAEFQS